MTSALFNAVPTGAIEVIFDINNQPWFKRADLGRYLGIIKIRDSFTNFQAEFLKRREEILGAGSTGSLGRYKNSTDIFLSIDGAIEVAVRSKKPMASELARWLARKGVEKIQEEHQLAIEEKDHQHQLAIENIDREHQQVVEEKDHEIEICQNQIVDLIENRHVPRIGKHDNILCAIQKNEPDELGKPGRHPYYMIRCQRMRLQERLHIKQLQYPNMVIKRPTYDAANAVICWVEFQKYIGKDSYYRNHFSLDNDDHRDFFANTFDIDM